MGNLYGVVTKNNADISALSDLFKKASDETLGCNGNYCSRAFSVRPSKENDRLMIFSHEVAPDKLQQTLAEAHTGHDVPEYKIAPAKEGLKTIYEMDYQTMA